MTARTEQAAPSVASGVEKDGKLVDRYGRVVPSTAYPASGAAIAARGQETPLTKQQVYDRFSFLEGLVSEDAYRKIADTAFDIQRERQLSACNFCLAQAAEAHAALASRPEPPAVDAGEKDAQAAINAIAALAPLRMLPGDRIRCQCCGYEWGGDLGIEGHAVNCAYVIATSVPHTPPASRQEAPAASAAVSAITYALETDEGLEFLRAWIHGDWEVIRKEWPDAPSTVFVSP